MTLKQNDFALVIEVVNNIRKKRLAAPMDSREIADIMTALYTCGWTVIRHGDLETLRQIVHRLEGKK